MWGGFLQMETGTVSQAKRASGLNPGSAGLGLSDNLRVKSLLLLWIMKAHDHEISWRLRRFHEISKSWNLRSFSVSGKSVLQPSTNFQHHRAEEASCVRWPPPSAFRPHTLHCRLPGTSWQMCILICDATLPWLGRIPTHEVSMSLTASCFSTNKSLKRKKKKKNAVDSVPPPVPILIWVRKSRQTSAQWLIAHYVALT